MFASWPENNNLFGDVQKEREMRLQLLLTLTLLAGCSTTATPPAVAVKEVASAKLVRADGSETGVATLSMQDDGIWLEMSSVAPGQGSFGIHMHTVGKCDSPDFTNAGPHWNPAGRQHGRDNPAGAHAGDLPNLTAGSDGRVSIKTMLEGAVWSGEGGLFDADGAALIVHEKADDYKTDPTGNSGKRVFCGVFTRP
jgi:Cu-Zn family superoxide dismutase